MDQELIDKWKKSARISAEARAYGATLIKPGASFLEISERVEQKIRSLGGQPAFPCQLSFNNTAAHNCAEPNDPLILSDELVKLDLGTHIDGCVSDNAVTVDLSGRWTELVKASKEACINAAKAAGPGVQVRAIGKIIDETISSHGFKAVRNLSGHGVGLYIVHDKPTIPNYDSKDTTTLKPGMVVAIEPFASTGAGMIQEADKANIFSFVQKKPVRSQMARDVLKLIEPLQGLPFTTRYFVKEMPLLKLSMGIKELVQTGVLHSYPPLNEVVHGAFVSQHENTLLISEDKAEVITVFDD